MACINTIIVLIYELLLLLLNDGVAGDNNPQFSAMFVFGDSLIDNGNNNYLNSYAKANFVPYGVDFPQGPTGRFTNGKTIIDFLAELTGLPYLPPFANPFATGRDIIYGVNYASAAGGILEESGEALGERFSLSKQVDNFNTTKNQLEDQMNETDVNQYLAKALTVMILGSNDYINNYLNPSYHTRTKYNPDQFADLLIDTYTKQVLRLYDLGLRNFFLAGIGAIGCSPNQRLAGRAPPGKCTSSSNDVVQLFNTRLRTQVDQLNGTIPDSTIIYGSTFDALMDIINHPDSYGLTVLDEACCGMGKNRAEKTCFPLSIPCMNRDQHAFWDGYHPTQAVHRFLALMAYNGPPAMTYPLNLKQLTQF